MVRHPADLLHVPMAALRSWVYPNHRRDEVFISAGGRRRWWEGDGHGDGAECCWACICHVSSGGTDCSIDIPDQSHAVPSSSATPQGPPNHQTARPWGLRDYRYVLGPW